MQLLSTRDPDRDDLLSFFRSGDDETSEDGRTLLIARLLVKLGFNRRRLATLPPELSLPLRVALGLCQAAAPKAEQLGPEELTLIDREDLLAQASRGNKDPGAFPSGSEDGLEDLEENMVAKLR